MRLMALALVVLVGCGSPEEKPGKKPFAKGDGGKKTQHKHGKGPHGGQVIDFGAYHAEIESKEKKVIVHILGDDEKTTEWIDSKELTLVTKAGKTITLKPDGAKDGKASRFVGEAAEPVEKLSGTLFGDIEGKRAEGEF